LSKGTKLQSPPIDAFVFSLEVENFLDAETYIEAAKNAPDVDPQTALQN
jgi:hypothetical protein